MIEAPSIVEMVPSQSPAYLCGKARPFATVYVSVNGLYKGRVPASQGGFWVFKHHDYAGKHRVAALQRCSEGMSPAALMDFEILAGADDGNHGNP